MSLFNRKRSVIALDEKSLGLIKQELESTLSIAKSFDAIMSKSTDIVISLEGRMRGDLLAFTLYLAGISNGVKQSEIDVVNHLFDIDLSHVDFELFRKDVGNRNFEHAVPPSILILKELGSKLQTEQTRTSDGATAADIAERSGVTDMSQELCHDLINLYALIGSALSSADGVITKRESEDLIRYLYLMTRAVDGPEAELPEGAARRTVEAHKRLFDKAPKIK